MVQSPRPEPVEVEWASERELASGRERELASGRERERASKRERDLMRNAAQLLWTELIGLRDIAVSQQRRRAYFFVSVVGLHFNVFT